MWWTEVVIGGWVGDAGLSSNQLIKYLCRNRSVKILDFSI